MIERTKKRYLSLAKHFYETRMKDSNITPQRIVDELKACAEDYRPDSFRILRNALAYDQEQKKFKDTGKKIRSVVNPVTANNSKLTKKPKQKRVKKISDKDARALADHVKKSGDKVLFASILLSNALGCRPAELFDLKIVDGKVFVEGAKKTNGTRGLDRLLDYEDVAGLSSAIQVLQVYKEKESTKAKSSSPAALVQGRLAVATKKLWSRRVARPTLYTFRHQMGSNLKASGMDRKEVAYIMGHQATKSVNVYGNSRNGNSKVRVSAGVSKDDISAVVRENHTTAPPAKEIDYGSSFDY